MCHVCACCGPFGASSWAQNEAALSDRACALAATPLDHSERHKSEVDFARPPKLVCISRAQRRDEGEEGAALQGNKPKRFALARSHLDCSCFSGGKSKSRFFP